MDWNLLIFVVFPYVAVVVAVVGSVIRWRLRPFSVSAVSSQLLERRKLFWGSIPFHWGILAILLMHLVALVVPSGIELWNRVPVRLYLLEATGLALAVWALAGLVVLVYRRVRSDRIRVVTTPMDGVVLGLLAVQIVTGIWIAAGYRFGSAWGTAVFVPYLRSLLTLQPRPELVANLPLVLQLHAASFFVFLVVFPFTRLVHIVTVPLGYLTRPWQIVVGMRRTPTPARSLREGWTARSGRDA
jgi:nitrate reductase gamma subunit